MKKSLRDHFSEIQMQAEIQLNLKFGTLNL